MPQMSPLSWLSLFMAFILLFGAAINKLYFSNMFIPQPKSSSTPNNPKESTSWMW